MLPCCDCIFKPPLSWEAKSVVISGVLVGIALAVIGRYALPKGSANMGCMYGGIGLACIATISNHLGFVYPDLEAWLEKIPDSKHVPPARFIIISFNNMDERPHHLEEAGYILLKTLQAIHRDFGSINQISAHSLGTVFLASALQLINEESECILPNQLWFDRGPTSIEAVSKSYGRFVAKVIHPIAKCVGWSLDVEGAIIAFSQKYDPGPEIIITGVQQDHRFSGAANLALGKEISKAHNIFRMLFNPPIQITGHTHAHHNLSPGILYGLYVTKTNHGHMRPQDSLTTTLMKRADLRDEVIERIA